MAAAIVVLGTASNVGKSWVCTALCRALARRGLKVRPFKAQNMSNNASPARRSDGSWGEIGRAQAAQAAAAGVEPHVDMNPILLKPTGPMGSQVVLLGRALGHMQAKAYWKEKAPWFSEVTAAYDRLAEDADVVVLEGAGSPVELNLMTRDVVNLPMARHAIARARERGEFGGIFLVGDIDRGGVFASLVGTVGLLPPEDRALMAGLIVNRFRGDPALFSTGPGLLEERSGVPVLGVLPYRRDIYIDDEDGPDATRFGGGEVDICVLRLPTVSNLTDLTSLAGVEGIGLRAAEVPEEVGNPDLLVIPGAKDTLSDLAWLRRQGLDRSVEAAAARGIPVLGLCGGYQMLGERLRDPEGVSGLAGDVPGLGLLPVETVFGREKRTLPVAGRSLGGWLLEEGAAVEGYEIRQGRSRVHGEPLLATPEPEGCVKGSVAGTYLHGLLDQPEVLRGLVTALRRRKGLSGDWDPQGAVKAREAGFEAAADVVDRHLALEPILDRIAARKR
ncbi:MAG: cobyric acid synthase [Myxococcota bacterium]|nr:cobyric acid synthase [Myxococcota bacterium]